MFGSYLLSLHVATDRDELFVLVLRGIDEAIQKVRGIRKEKQKEKKMPR